MYPGMDGGGEAYDGPVPKATGGLTEGSIIVRLEAPSGLRPWASEEIAEGNRVLRECGTKDDMCSGCLCSKILYGM